MNNNTQGEHSISTMACPATEALVKFNSNPSSCLPRNNLASVVTDKLSTKMKAFHLSSQGAPPSTTGATDALNGISKLVSPSTSHSSLEKGEISSSFVDSFDFSDLARATHPVEESVAFPVIEWASDEEEDNDSNDDDCHDFLAPLSQLNNDEDDDEEETPVLFRPGTAFSSKMRKRRFCDADEDSIPSSKRRMQRTKSHKSCLDSLSSQDLNSSLLTSSPATTAMSLGLEDTSPLTTAHTVHQNDYDNWGQFIQPGTEEEDTTVPVLFAVSLTSSSSKKKKNRMSFRQSHRRVYN